MIEAKFYIRLPPIVRAVKYTRGNYDELFRWVEQHNESLIDKHIAIGDYVCFDEEGKMLILTGAYFKNCYEEIEEP